MFVGVPWAHDQIWWVMESESPSLFRSRLLFPTYVFFRTSFLYFCNSLGMKASSLLKSCQSDVVAPQNVRYTWKVNIHFLLPLLQNLPSVHHFCLHFGGNSKWAVYYLATFYYGNMICWSALLSKSYNIQREQRAPFYRSVCLPEACLPSSQHHVLHSIICDFR